MFPLYKSSMRIVRKVVIALLLVNAFALSAGAWGYQGETRDWTLSVQGERYGLVEWVSTTSRTPTVVKTQFYAGRFLVAAPGRIELWTGLSVLGPLGSLVLLINFARRKLT